MDPAGLITGADAGRGAEALLVNWYDSARRRRRASRLLPRPGDDTYRHVLLVDPYIDAAGKPTYEIVGRPQGGIHAGGIVWHGNELYVADTTRGIRVFDMRPIFDLGAERRHGRRDTDRPRAARYYGFGYRYVMPQVGAWVNAAGPDTTATSRARPTARRSSPRSGSTAAALITSEYRDSGARGRVAGWPLVGRQARRGRPPPATEAFRLPGRHVQGAVWVDGT